MTSFEFNILFNVKHRNDTIILEMIQCPRCRKYKSTYFDFPVYDPKRTYIIQPCTECVERK